MITATATPAPIAALRSETNYKRMKRSNRHQIMYFTLILIQHQLMRISEVTNGLFTVRERDRYRHREWDWYNRKQCVLVPFLSQTSVNIST